MQRRSFLAATGGVIAPLVAGCLGADDEGAEETPTSTPTEEADESPTPTETETETPTPTEELDDEGTQERYSDYNWDRLENADAVATGTVTLRNSTFDPLIAAVKPGTDVTFTNEDSFGHTVTIPKLDVDEQLDGGQSTTVTVEETDTYDYVCTIHPPDMLGRIEVTEDPPDRTPEETPTLTPTETDDDDDDGGGGYY